MLPHPIAKCSKTVAANASAAPLDVVKMKSVLKALGHYEAPEWGVSQYPDAALFDAIKAFQRSQGLKTDGTVKPDGETEAALSRALTPRRATTALQNTAQALQAMGRGGDELLAHITREEAALLNSVTDGATINPQTGLLEFFWGGSDRDYDGNGYDNDAQHGETNASAAEASDVQAAENDRQGRDDTRDNDGGDRVSNPQSRGDNDGGITQNGDDGQGLGGKSGGAQTQSNQKEDKGTLSRRASAKEDTLPGDVLGGGGLFSQKEEEEEGLMDLTIEEVEAQNKEILARSKQLVQEAKKQEEEDQKVWSAPRFYGPPPPPPTPSGGPRRWSNRPKTKPKYLPETKPKTGRPGDPVNQKMQQMMLDKFIKDATEIAKVLSLIDVNRVSPMMTLPGFEDAWEKAKKRYTLEDDDPV